MVGFHGGVVMTPEFKLVNEMFGTGDPGSAERRGIWFIGIEEGGEPWKTRKEVLDKSEEYKGKQFVSCVSDTKLYSSYMAKIVCGASPLIRSKYPDDFERNVQPWMENPEKKEIWQEYRDKFLQQPGSGVCNANLFPLGKNAITSWPDHYEELFGFGQKDFDRYRDLVRKTRFVRMRDSWEKCNPLTTICYVDVTYRDEIDRLFGTCRWTDLGERLQGDVDRRIILCPHLSRPRMSDVVARLVAEYLREWRVELPT